MLYTTLTYNGVEKPLGDWGVSSWSRLVQNQADDVFNLTIPTPMAGGDIFPYAAQIIIKINRVASSINPINPTLPIVFANTAATFSGGTQWFWGYCTDNDRAGDPGSESFNYKFVGPYQFFFDKLIFQQLQLTWNPDAAIWGGKQQIADWQSKVILGLSLTVLTGTGDTVQGSTATNLMSIAQQLKQIMAFAQQASVFMQANPSLFPFSAGIATWTTSGAQFQCDANAYDSNGNYDLLQTPSANVLIADYAGTAVSGYTSASTLPAGSYQLRPPLDAASGITCKNAMGRMLQWIGGIGAPVVWTDHSQTPPMLRIATRDLLISSGYTKTLALAGITVKNKIKQRFDLVPTCVHFKYNVSGTYLGSPFNQVINDIAAYIDGSLVVGLGNLGALTGYNGGTLSIAHQTQLMEMALTPGAMVQTFDLAGDQTTAQSCAIKTQPLNLVDPAGTGADGGFWASLFPELANVTQNTLKFFNGGVPGVTITDATTPTTVYYSSGAWQAVGGSTVEYVNRLTDGQIAPWMLANASNPASPVAGQTVRAKITARFQYQQQLQGAAAAYATNQTCAYIEKNIEVTLTTLSSGTYTSQPITQTGEPVPYGLAGYILALESLPIFEGSILVQETEISDVCPIGNVLNISGGLAAWSTMNATVQSLRYSDNGQTEITFGPAKHLGAAQLIQRMRTNLGPRWYLMYSSNPMNNTPSGGNSLGNNIAAKAPTDGGQNFTFLSLLSNLTAQQGTGTGGNVATLPAGTHIDTGLVPTPFSGTIASGQLVFRVGQGITLAQGPYGTSPGESMAWIRLHMGDLQNATGSPQNLHPYLREIPDCKTIGGTPTPGYRLVLCSEFYTTSIRATPDP